MNKDDICENNNIGYYAYKFGYKVVLNNKSALKYETTYKGQFEINQCWINCTVTL